MKYLWLLLTSCCIPLHAASTSMRVVTEYLPPYQIVQHGKLSGTSVAVVKALLKRADIDAPIEVLPWARAFQIAATQPNVMIFSMARNKEREHQFYWLLKLRDLTYHFYTRADKPISKINSLAEALQHTVVAVRNSYEANSLKKLGFVEGKNLILTLDYVRAWQMLHKGRADFTYANELIESTVYRLLHIEAKAFVADFDLGETSNLYIAVNIHSSKDIVDKLTHTLRAMQQDGTLRQILPTAELPQ